MPAENRITVCIPHWQVERYARLCLRSIRRHSRKYDLEVIVVDNGSQDASLDYLRSLDWIRLIERPDERHTNWPLNVFTAWDRGLAEATGAYYLTMHSDVFVRRDGWLDPLLAAITGDHRMAAAGAWKLEVEHPLYTIQKRVVSGALARLKGLWGRAKPREARRVARQYPRDYCALYRREILVQERMQFRPLPGDGGGGCSIARQIWEAGYETCVIPVTQMAGCVFHVAHGTAAVSAEKPLNHRRAQRKVEHKVAGLFEQPWIRDLEADASLDAASCAAA